MTPIEITLAIILVIGTIAAGIVKFMDRRQDDLDDIQTLHAEELLALAATRKEIIAELRQEMNEMRTEHAKEIANLETQIAELRGQYHALRNFQMREMIEGVTTGVLEGLGAIDL